MSEPFVLHCGNSLDILKNYPDNHFDSIVTDPPYGISFMGRKWDYDVPSQEIWSECLRVLKPGGHMLAFAGTRTQHRMAVRIEDAGFEIRDMIAWVYGSGMPKSLDVSKAIDKRGGASVAWFGPWFRKWREAKGLTQKDVCERCGFYGEVNRGGAVANWELGLNMPTPDQFNMICDTFDLPFGSMEEAKREIIGKGVSGKTAIWSEEGGMGDFDITAPATDAAKKWDGWGTSLKPALEPITVARKPLIGTVAENVLAHGTGAINIDSCRIPTSDKLGGGGEKAETSAKFTNDGWKRPWMDDPEQLEAQAAKVRANVEKAESLGRFPANLIHDGSDDVVSLFPHADKYGSAARFFYCAKTNNSDRNEGVSAGTNNHPTVKPTDLMVYLCRLVTPPNGIILDPFMGSGSTGKAAIREGFKFVGIDMQQEYVDISNARISHELKESTKLKSTSEQLDI